MNGSSSPEKLYQPALLPYHVREVYDQFQTPENLRQHMLWVAGVGTVICDLLPNADINTYLVVGSLLLHDLGNVIKYDFSRPELLSPQDQRRITELQEQQTQMRQKYGEDPDTATGAFVRSIGAHTNIVELIQNMHMRNLDRIVQQGTLEEKITTYADLRVSPHGIVSLHERIADAQVRYPHLREVILKQAALCDELERQLAQLMIKNPAFISQTDVEKTLDRVRSFDLYTLR